MIIHLIVGINGREREGKIRGPVYISSCSAEFRLGKEKNSVGERRGRWAQRRTQARLRDAVRADPAIDFRGGGMSFLSLSFSLRASMNKNEPMLTSAMLDTESTAVCRLFGNRPRGHPTRSTFPIRKRKDAFPLPLPFSFRISISRSKKVSRICRYRISVHTSGLTREKG